MFINPKTIVDQFGVMPGMKAAEFGSGSGHFSIEIAKHLGVNGLLYSFDVRREALESLKSLSVANNLLNIETVQVNLEKEKSTGLTDGILDMVLAFNVMFQIGDKAAVSREAFRILKNGGKMFVIDWKQSSVIGPAAQVRVRKEEMKSIFARAGFEFKEEFDAGESHYGLNFMKPITYNL